MWQACQTPLAAVGLSSYPLWHFEAPHACFPAPDTDPGRDDGVAATDKIYSLIRMLSSVMKDWSIVFCIDCPRYQAQSDGESHGTAMQITVNGLGKSPAERLLTNIRIIQWEQLENYDGGGEIWLKKPSDNTHEKSHSHHITKKHNYSITLNGISVQSFNLIIAFGDIWTLVH